MKQKNSFRSRYVGFCLSALKMLISAYPHGNLILLVHSNKKIFKFRFFPNNRILGMFTSYDSVEFTNPSVASSFLAEL